MQVGFHLSVPHVQADRNIFLNQASHYIEAKHATAAFHETPSWRILTRPVVQYLERLEKRVPIEDLRVWSCRYCHKYHNGLECQRTLINHTRGR